MLIHRETGTYSCRFFDRFDEEGRRFEDRLRSGAAMAGTIPWPRISFWQGYRHLQSVSNRYFVLQMARKDSAATYQMAAVEHASKIALFRTGEVPYWIPSQGPAALRDQAELLELMRELCRELTSLMSLQVHAYVPGDPALEAAEALLRGAGFPPCDRRAPETTRLIDLRPSVEELFSLFPAKVRTKLRLKKPEEVAVAELKSRGQIPALKAALDDSFHRSSEQRYDYDFESLFKVLAEFPETAAAFGFFLAGEPQVPKAFVAGVASPPLFEYTLAGSRSDSRLRQFKFNYVLLWRLIEAAKERGATVFDMGGITEGGDGDPLSGISDFKRRFPGFDVAVGREGRAELRPARRRVFSALKSLKKRL
ncbi:MAG: GNAT family N-acetyltransferase [Elusimicrobiota bacterium]